jgi:hypothetical protein
MSDESNKAVVNELCNLINQAHAAATDETVPLNARQALYSFGNYMAARARTRLWAIEDEVYRDQMKDSEEQIAALADLHLASMRPNLGNQEQEEKSDEPTTDE